MEDIKKSFSEEESNEYMAEEYYADEQEFEDYECGREYDEGYYDRSFEQDRPIEDYYNEFSGSYAYYYEGCSEEFINEVLEGDPEAYWNID